MSERKGTKALELWCKRLVKDCPEIQIENMTTSWRNGMAFCALVHHFRPDLIDMSKLKPENIYENNQLAFSVAEKHLGIPALLDPEDMVENDVPDRLSILTYLSQFYQRLGHTVNTKASESESTKSTESKHPAAPIKFGKTGLDKCTACGLPVYLAQRLMVSHKLYHRRCFRCSKCSGHLNPKNYHIIEGSEFLCDSCKNEKTLLKYLNNNDHDQMGMLAFGDNSPDAKLDISKEDIVVTKQKSRPSSVLEKISMFEKNDKETNINSKFSNISITDTTDNSYKELSGNSGPQIESDSKKIATNEKVISIETENMVPKNIPDKVYKSNIDKFNFLQTQLSGDSIIDNDKTAQEIEDKDKKHKDEDYVNKTCDSDIKTIDEINKSITNDISDESFSAIKEDTNITDDIRISKIPTTVNTSIMEKECSIDKNSTTADLSTTASVRDIIVEKNLASTDPLVAERDGSAKEDTSRTEDVKISVPPRRKKQHATEKSRTVVKKDVMTKTETQEYPEEYPDHLNPFSDDEEEEEPSNDHGSKKESTNPFGSTDEEDDDVPPIQPPPKIPGVDTSTPVKRLIAVNPFWSDGEEPSTDEEDDRSKESKGTYSSLATSTPNLPGSTPRRKKPKAPMPPVITFNDTSRSHATSVDDVASLSSLSSYNSTAHSDQKSYEKSTPRLKKRPAPAPLDSLSTVSGHGGSVEKEVDASGLKNTFGFDAGKKKGPAPGLPLPERREVKLQMSPEELQVQLDLLETQQLGLERQGVLIERMIRDKCDEPSTVPQEEVEDLVIQLCELVNEKNDLFRKQTELMYIRRQQRLEQEQADIEHEIRIIQSRPAVNRIDSDKAREEQLVSRLVEIVRMRDELVQQLDAERRRERQEDLAIAASIASKRAQRNSDSSSMKSAEVSTASTPKKNKVKDKVKKQLKKAKHTLISKKKDDSSDRKEGKEDKVEKEKKSK